MQRSLILGAWLLGATFCAAGTGTVQWQEVDVRSGPSEKFYATGKLRKGDAVVILSEDKVYLKIQPPAGSFSYVQKDAVQIGSDPRVGEIIKEEIPLRVGSTLDGKAANVSTRKLQLGEKVTILGEVFLRLGANDVAFYRVQLAQDWRFVLKDAIQVQENGAAPAAPAAPAASTPTTTAPEQEPTLPPGTPGEEINKARAAHRAYVAGKSNGDFREARRLFTELAASRNAATRALAVNYLEYVRQWEQGKHNVARSTYPQAPRATSSYTYAPDTGPARTPAGPSDRIPPTTLPPAPPGDVRPPATNPARSWTGLLNASGRRIHRGLPLYAIVDGRGNLKCYVTSATSSLEPYVGRNVEVVGQGVYEKDLRGDLVQVQQIKPLDK